MASSFPSFLSFLLPSKSSQPDPDATNNLAIPSSPPPPSSAARPQAPVSLANPSPRPLESDPSRSSDDFDLSAVICPSLAHSNTLFFSSPLLRHSRMATIPWRGHERGLSDPAGRQKPKAKGQKRDCMTERWWNDSRESGSQE